MLTVSYGAGIVLISFHRDRFHTQTAQGGAGRPLREILKSPILILAVCAAAVGYGVMSLLMTATPISMHTHAGHSLESTKFVIQSHIAAMYLPSLLYAALFSRLGFRGMLWLGALVYLICLGIAAMNTEFLTYWLALILLGIGWNFLFLSGTNLLPYGYRPEERFRVQSANDFMVFSVQALASLGSGWLLYHWRWQGIIYACIPLVVGFFVVLIRCNEHLKSLYNK